MHGQRHRALDHTTAARQDEADVIHALHQEART